MSSLMQPMRSPQALPLCSVQLQVDHMQLFEIWSLVRSILHAPLIPSEKFNISALIAAHGSSVDRNAWLAVQPLFKQQLHFWWTMLKTVDSAAYIQRTEQFPAWTLEFYTDTAGGSPSSSNGNASETKANESFDNCVFFDIDERTPSLERKIFSKHIRQNKN
jgi:hypothetical protein